jgi:hypothetical protein
LPGYASLVVHSRLLLTLKNFLVVIAVFTRFADARLKNIGRLKQTRNLPACPAPVCGPFRHYY